MQLWKVETERKTKQVFSELPEIFSNSWRAQNRFLASTLMKKLLQRLFICFNDVFLNRWSVKAKECSFQNLDLQRIDCFSEMCWVIEKIITSDFCSNGCNELLRSTIACFEINFLVRPSNVFKLHWDDFRISLMKAKIWRL